jgi:hypothetical protein
MQPRCTMNLAKATKLIDDRSSLLQPDGSGKNKRRKSGFGDDDDAYVFIEEGFRVRFANGECIDFYANTSEDKAGWMNVLRDVIGKDGSQAGKAWTDIVLNKERAAKKTSDTSSKQEDIQKKPVSEAPAPPKKNHAARESMHLERLEIKADGVPLAPPPASRTSHAVNGSTKSAPTSPKKQHVRGQSMQSSPPKTGLLASMDKFSMHPGQRRLEKTNDRRKQVRSMIF